MTLLHRCIFDRGYNGIISGWFPGRYTRPKTGIFSRSQYELSSLQNFVLRHIGGIAPLRSRDCPISTEPLTFTHGEISQKFFRKKIRTLPQVAPHSPAEFAPSRRNPQNPPKLPQNPGLCYLPQKFFQKIFSNFFSKNFEILGRLRQNCAKCYIARNFSQIFFPKIFGIFNLYVTPPVRS